MPKNLRGITGSVRFDKQLNTNKMTATKFYPVKTTNPEIKLETRGDEWVRGTYQGFTFDAKVYREPAEGYGKGDGKVSKLTIYDDKIKWVVNYDRGWDTKPGSKFLDTITSAIVLELEENTNI